MMTRNLQLVVALVALTDFIKSHKQSVLHGLTKRETSDLMDALHLANEAFLSPVSNWQPIETAPTTGREVILWFKGRGKASIGWFDCDEEYRDRPEWWISPEYGWRNEGDQCIPVNQEDCTHWMELPVGPND